MSEKTLKDELLEDEPVQLEKNDIPAMLISGCLTIGLPCVLMLGLIAAVVLLLFT